MDDFKAAVEAFLLIIISIITIFLAADIYLKQKVFQTFRLFVFSLLLKVGTINFFVDWIGTANLGY